MLRMEYFVHLLLVVFVINIAITISNAKNVSVNRCNDESCGEMKNISYPFWIEDEKCGEPKYKLFCDTNKTTQIIIKGFKYNVLSINRANLTIRLVDSLLHKQNCSSVPLNTLSFAKITHLNFYDLIKDQSFYNVYDQNREITFLSCEKPLKNSSLFIDTKPCTNKSLHNYSYVTSDAAKVSDIGETCSVDFVTMSAKPSKCGLNCSYSEIHDSIAFGFELSWKTIACQNNCNGMGICTLEAGGNKIIGCSGHCDIICWIERIAESVSFGFLFPMFYLIALIVILRFIIGVPIYFIFLIYKWRRRHKSMYDSVEKFLQNQNNLRPIKYSYSNIKKITKNFKDKLGQGGYGSVYKGRIRSGRDVAVKVLGKSKSNGQDFINEVASIGRIHHVNVVRLIGFCAEDSKRALVYEFMSNGSLEKHIIPRDENVSLSYEKMLEISLGVAHGIEYLHRGCDMHILHFDIKPHNILLDENFKPKISDFGLARLYPTNSQSVVSLTAAIGTIGYMAPELFYKNIGSISHKADVYSYGMLLLEMAGKRRVPKDSSQVYFHSWVYDHVCQGNSSGLIGDISIDETRLVRKMVIVGLWCIQTRPDDRPSMNKVIEMLESETESLEIPPKPTLYVEEVSDPMSSTILLGDSIESLSLILNVT